MRRWITLICIVGCMAALAGCNLTTTSTPTVGGVDPIRTAAARTLDAVSTKMAESPKETVVLGKDTPVPPAKTAVTAAVSPSAVVTARPGSATPVPSSAAPCDQVSFVRDISFPDGSLLQPGTAFRKTWELKNSGTCAWNSNYTLVFANEGNVMGGVVSQPLVTSGAVQPGDLVQVSVDLKAPAAVGEYKGHWRLRNPAGSDFGPAGKTFWVAIQVKAATASFIIDSLCSATWKNASDVIACPGKPGDAKGSISRVETPKFSTGYLDNEPAFLMEPQQITDGVIVGEFPAYQLTAAQTQFRTVIACNYNAKNCNAKVKITAQAGSEAEQTLGEWDVQYKNDWIMVRVDLASKSLVGKAVVLRYTVRANGSASQDQILFLSPVFVAP